MQPDLESATGAVRVPTRTSRLSLNYLTPMACSAPLGMGLNYLFPDAGVKGFSLGIIVGVMLTALSSVMWLGLVRQGTRTARALVAVFLGASLVTWVALNAVSRIGDQAVTYLTVMLPIFIVMVAVRMPSRQAIYNAMGGIVVTTVVVLSITETAAFLIGRPRDPIGFTVRWPWAAQLLGLENSWYGPFDWVSDAGIAGAFILVFGLASRGWARWIAITAGAVIVLAPQRETPVFGIIAALVVLLAFNRSGIFGRFSLRIRRIVAAIIVILPVAYVLLRDPSLRGRSQWYSACLDVWRDFPISGYMSVSDGPGLASAAGCNYAHNVFIGALAGYGVVGFALVSLVVLLGALIAFRAAARQGSTLGLAVVAAFVVIGLAETHGDPRYFGGSWMWFYLAVMYASANYLVAIGDKGDS